MIWHKPEPLNCESFAIQLYSSIIEDKDSDAAQGQVGQDFSRVGHNVDPGLQVSMESQ